MAESFVHLHLHSEYSLLDGGNRIERLIARVRELGMDTVALTDHGNLHGAVAFYNAAKKAGIKPILGIEAYVAADLNGKQSDRKGREFTGVADGGFHLVLLAEDQVGWRNLIKLSSDSYVHGFYYRPRMDKSTLAQWGQGLIAINGHLGSSIAHHLTRYVQSNDPAHWQAAIDEAKWHARTFGTNAKGEPRFYVELQRHDIPEQEAINPHLLRLAQELDLPLVADNDAHFLMADDHDVHDTLICVSTGKLKSEENRLRYSPQLYVKSAGQMAELFEDLPEAIANTRKIADRCEVELDFSQNHAPVVKIEKRDDPATLAEHVEGSTEWFQAFCGQFVLEPFDAVNDKTPADQLKKQCDEALRALTEAGAIWRYGKDGITDAIRGRIDRELTILAEKNISAYFLIVWDFVNEARRRGIPAGARGSGVGTMVGYCLGLSNACPVEYGLLFERFTDPDRSEYPDIDIDMCQDGRGEILEYVRQKYGHVAQIITFGTLKARAAVRDVGRVLNVPLATVDKVCKLIGGALGTTLEQALEQEADLKSLYEGDDSIRQMLDTAMRLEGHARHAGVHAAGVVIATQPLDNIVPLYQPPGTDQLVTQWDGPTVGKVGLLKIDFLGLRTLSIIERARKLVRQSLTPQVVKGTVDAEGTRAAEWDPLDLDRLTFDDPKVLDLFCRGETAGVFQFESGGMRNLLMAMKPDRFEDLVAANALYRPGPMALIDDYNARKHGTQRVPSVHPVVDRYTQETYGVMVYQEQVMQIVHELGDIPLRAVYTLIKAISKKDRNIIDANRTKFVEGAGQKGLSEAQAEKLWELILQFAGYGFNKSHSAGYGIIAYQTAYLKTYFPVQYMAALLTYESVSTDKVVEYIGECKRVTLPDGRRGIEVGPPDINRSEVGFTVVYEADEVHDAAHGHIRYGLGAVKGVGEKAVLAIMEARQADKGGRFKSLYDFCERVPLGAVNKATIEALIKCGAFDLIHGQESRAALVEALDGAMQAGQRAAADRESGQMNFFEAAADEGAAAKTAAALPEVTLPKTAPWKRTEQSKFEKEVLGFHWTDPLQDHQRTLDRFASATIADVRRLAAEVTVVLGGILTRVRLTLTKNGRSAGQKMAMITLSDGTEQIDGVAFAETYAQYAPLLAEDQVVLVKGRVDRRREEPSVVVEQVIAVEQAPAYLTQAVRIAVPTPTEGNGNERPRFNGALAKLKTLLMQAAGGQAANGSTRSEVLLEVRDAGRVVCLRVNGLRVPVDGDLAQRIETVLESPGCCELIGPTKVRVEGATVYSGEREAGIPMFTAGDEVCASIDRY